MKSEGRCLEHLDFAGSVCPECKEPVDDYGNTEYQFENCSFPDCGCDGHRLCMVGAPNDNAVKCNVEGMWLSNSTKAKRARLELYGLVNNLKKEERND